NRFRILVCINGTDSCYDGLKRAAEFGRRDECDIILLYVRRVDQGLNSGGLQVRVARQNMLDWGLDLPGIEYLKRGLKALEDDGFMDKAWKANFSHSDVFGDPLGDNKVEYRNAAGKSIVLKLKTAPDVVSGILDQYELGPYNLIIMGPPKRWSSEFASFWEPSSVQKVAAMAPCSVLSTRGYQGRKRGFLLCIDGSERAYRAMTQAAVLAHLSDRPMTIISVATDNSLRATAKATVDRGAAMLAELGMTRVKTLVKVGDPASEILKASERFALVVVADSRKSRIKRFLVGSVAFDVMGKSEISVLNVR
ncbi:MAG: universal stress protein, partial [Fimbriimonadaceae bacterium]|nr:universal stress protein [Alphaproteobacteria bacterium]